MKNRVLFAFISMFFADFRSVIAKQGLVEIYGELGRLGYQKIVRMPFCDGICCFFGFNATNKSYKSEEFIVVRIIRGYNCNIMDLLF